MRTRVKICGITRPEDAAEAARLGADAVGLIFADASPRRVDIAAAAAVRAATPPFVSVVALFMDASAAEVEQVLARVPVDLLQFHGSETRAYCESFPRPYVKVIPMGAAGEPADRMAEHPAAAGFVLDGHGAGEPGGSGRTFDWDRVPGGARPIILAGGLTADNAGRAVRQVRPWAVDTSSGVESAPGVKDARRMAAFISEVRRGTDD